MARKQYPRLSGHGVFSSSGIAEDGLDAGKSDGIPRGEVLLKSPAEILFDESLAVLRGQPFAERTRCRPHGRFQACTALLAFRVGFRMIRQVASQCFDQRKRVRISI